MLVNTVDVQETLGVFDIVAHWLSVSFLEAIKTRKLQQGAADLLLFFLT